MHTIYATFTDVESAEKAAGALLDHGVRSEDLSLIRHGDDPSLAQATLETSTPGGQVAAGGHETGFSNPHAVDAEYVPGGSETTLGGPGTLQTSDPRYSSSMAPGTGTSGISGSPSQLGTNRDTDNAINTAGAQVGAEIADAIEGRDVDDARTQRSDYREDVALGGGTVSQPRDLQSGVPYPGAESTAGRTDPRDNPSSAYGSAGTSRLENDVEPMTGTRTDAWDGDNADRTTDANRDPDDVAKAGITTTTPADAGAGAIKGTGIGLGVGALAALAALFVPGVGLVVGGGALAAALGGIAASAGAGAAAGAVTGYLKDQGMDEHIAGRYGEAISGGGALIALTVPSGEVNEYDARQILSKYGAQNVEAHARSGGYMG